MWDGWAPRIQSARPGVPFTQNGTGVHGYVYDIISSNAWEETQSNTEGGNIHNTGNTLAILGKQSNTEKTCNTSNTCNIWNTDHYRVYI